MREQAPPERAARMRAREILGAEALGVEQGDRERIAQGQRRGGARSGGEVQRTGLLVHARVQVHVGFARQRRIGIAGDRDQARPLAFEQGHDGEQFLAFARVGQRDQHVVARDHADVAVARLGRMHEVGRRAGARHGGGDLARDMAGLADAAHHHAALAVEQQRHGVEKALVQPRSEALDGFGFDGEHLSCQLQRGLGR